MPRPDRILLGAAFIIAGELCFATMGVGIRMVSGELPNAMVVFARNLVALLLLAPWLLRHGLADVRTAVPGLHLLRAVAGVGAMYCFFYAIAAVPLADAMLLKLTTPIFIPMIALPWLGERVTPRVWLAIIVGFLGVAVVLDPRPPAGTIAAHWAWVSPVALVGLLGGALAALALVTVRRLSRTEPIRRIVFHFALIAALISAVPLVWDWQTPSPRALGWLVWIGVVATLGQLALTRGLSLAPAARMGAFAYFSVLFGATFGWALWDEPITPAIVLGSTLVALAGVIASRVRPSVMPIGATGITAAGEPTGDAVASLCDEAPVTIPAPGAIGRGQG